MAHYNGNDGINCRKRSSWWCDAKSRKRNSWLNWRNSKVMLHLATRIRKICTHPGTFQVVTHTRAIIFSYGTWNSARLGNATVNDIHVKANSLGDRPVQTLNPVYTSFSCLISFMVWEALGPMITQSWDRFVNTIFGWTLVIPKVCKHAPTLLCLLVLVFRIQLRAT